jgi:hypothetical protein
MGEGVLIPAEPGDLAQVHREVGAEKLHERQVHQAGRRIAGLRQERDQAGRDEGTGGIVDVLAKAAQALHAQEPTRQEAELLRIDVEGVLGRAPVRRDLVLPAARHALERLQQVDVQHHAFLAEFVPQPAPVAGKPGSGPEVAPPGGGDVDGLRARGACHDQHDQTKDDRPRAGGAMEQ